MYNVEAESRVITQQHKRTVLSSGPNELTVFVPISVGKAASVPDALFIDVRKP